MRDGRKRKQLAGSWNEKHLTKEKRFDSRRKEETKQQQLASRSRTKAPAAKEALSAATAPAKEAEWVTEWVNEWMKERAETPVVSCPLKHKALSAKRGRDVEGLTPTRRVDQS